MEETLTDPGLLVVVSSNQRRGAEVQAQRTAERLAHRGWRVELVSLTDSPAPNVGADPLSPNPPDGLKRLSPRLLLSLRRRLRQRNIRAVIAWGGATLRYVAIAKAGLGLDSSCYVSVGIPSTWIRSRARGWLYRVFANSYGVIAAVSRATAEDLINNVGVSESKVKVVRSGIPEELLDIPAARDRIDRLRLLYVGSLTPEKDPLAAARIATEAARSSPLTLRVVGSGPLQSALEEVAASTGDLLELVGTVADVKEHLSWCDILLLTSRTEGLPGVVLEAMGAGRPVVAFDVGALAEVVEHGSSGLLLTPGSISAGVDAVGQLAGNGELRIQMGVAARQTIQSRFLMDRAVAAFDDVLRSQLG